MAPPTNKQIKVTIAGLEPNNKNTAAYNRFEANIKMVKASFDCNVILAKRGNTKSRIYNGFIGRLHFFRSLARLAKESDGRQYKHILYLRYIDHFCCLAAWLMLKNKGVGFARERNEYPSVFIERKNKLALFIYKYLVMSWSFRFFDVFFCISNDLIEFYQKYTKKNCVMQKLPMTVDFSRFNGVEKLECRPYVFYAGSLSESKDGVESLIHAFYHVSKAHSDLCLKIAGGPKDGSQAQKLHRIINEYQIGEKVQLLGLIDRQHIAKYLCSAKIVVLARPDSLQARGGFPTKLGEYMASSNPVIVTRVGEVPQYLSKDQVFFISPHNIQNELMAKLQYILANYDQAKQIAHNGKLAARKYFSVESNQKYIKNALEMLFKSEYES